MGISGVEGVPTVSVGITLKIRVTSFIIIGHRGGGNFMEEFKGRGGLSKVGEAVNFGLEGFPWVVIRFRGWRWGRFWEIF
jgi:hypothetical protein